MSRIAYRNLQFAICNLKGVNSGFCKKMAQDENRQAQASQAPQGDPLPAAEE
jgi:hypothetical protein